MASDRQIQAANQPASTKSAGRWVHPLSRIVSQVVMPQLVGAHRVPEQDHGAALLAGEAARDGADLNQCAGLDRRDLDTFCAALVGGDLAAARALLDAYAARRGDRTFLLAHVIAPAAEDLGRRWNAADCRFIDVTVGSGILQILVRDVALRATSQSRAVHGKSARLFSAIGEQHTLGTMLVAETFRSAGWTVDAEQPSTIEDVVNSVSQKHYDVIGISIAHTRDLKDLAETARMLKTASMNSDVRLLVGGNVFRHGAPAVSVDRSAIDICVGPSTCLDELAVQLSETAPTDFDVLVAGRGRPNGHDAAPASL